LARNWPSLPRGLLRSAINTGVSAPGCTGLGAWEGNLYMIILARKSRPQGVKAADSPIQSCLVRVVDDNPGQGGPVGFGAGLEAFKSSQRSLHRHVGQTGQWTARRAELMMVGICCQSASTQ
jgi:hypothetical protein